MNAPLGAHALALLAQLEADAEARVLQRLSEKDEVIVLHPMEAAEPAYCRARGDYIYLEDFRGAGVELHRNRLEPESWRGCPLMAGLWHPSYWQGHINLVDGQGRRWSHDVPPMVMDDFGNLVPAGARA